MSVSEQGACSVVPREDIHAFKVASYDEVNGPAWFKNLQEHITV